MWSSNGGCREIAKYWHKIKASQGNNIRFAFQHSTHKTMAASKLYAIRKISVCEYDETGEEEKSSSSTQPPHSTCCTRDIQYFSTFKPQHKFSNCCSGSSGSSKEKAIVCAKRSRDEFLNGVQNSAQLLRFHTRAFNILNNKKIYTHLRCICLVKKKANSFWCVPFISFHLQLAFFPLPFLCVKTMRRSQYNDWHKRDGKKCALDVVFGFLNKSIKRLFYFNANNHTHRVWRGCGRVHVWFALFHCSRQIAFVTNQHGLQIEGDIFFSFQMFVAFGHNFYFIGRCISGYWVDTRYIWLYFS